MKVKKNGRLIVWAIYSLYASILWFLPACGQPKKENVSKTITVENDINKTSVSIDDTYEKDMKKIDEELNFIMKGL